MWNERTQKLIDVGRKEKGKVARETGRKEKVDPKERAGPKETLVTRPFRKQCGVQFCLCSRLAIDLSSKARVYHLITHAESNDSVAVECDILGIFLFSVKHHVGRSANAC